MSVLQLGDRKFTIPLGEVVLGSDAGCAIPLSGAGVLPQHVLVQGQADGQVVIRKATDAAEVLVNGVRLGAEPTPLLHGDKVEVGNHALTFVDERRSGSTQFVPKVPAPEGVGQVRATARPGGTGNTGGRVVSLTDGREYVITGKSLVFGREADCDVVVPGKDVSRRHAEIVETPKGYLLVDSSTNGTLANDQPVQGQRMLERGDVIRIGDQSFRFYADALPAAVPPPGAEQRLQHTLLGIEGVARPPKPPQPPQVGPLASFLVRSGALKGQRLPVRTPVVNLGRADYNDLVLPDPSVSTAHAKLQRREGVWIVVDLESTNGTFVDGERVKGESPLAPGAIVRCGDVQLVFEPTDDAVGLAEGGGTQVLKTPASLAPTRPAAPSPFSPPSRPSPAAPTGPPSRQVHSAPLPPPPAKHRPPAKAQPAVRRPTAQQPPRQKGKGCGVGAAALLLPIAGIVALLHRLLA